jgi:hypothetical protein
VMDVGRESISDLIRYGSSRGSHTDSTITILLPTTVGDQQTLEPFFFLERTSALPLIRQLGSGFERLELSCSSVCVGLRGRGRGCGSWRREAFEAKGFEVGLFGHESGNVVGDLNRERDVVDRTA